MNAFEKGIWSVAFMHGYAEANELRKREPHRSTMKDADVFKLAVESADHLVMELRERTETVPLHCIDDLEQERRAELNLPEMPWDDRVDAVAALRESADDDHG